MSTMQDEGYDTLRRVRQRTEERSTLQDLAQELERLEETKRDYVVDTRRMSFVTTDVYESREDPPLPAARTSYLTFDSPEHDHDEGTGGGPVNDHAHSQIRERLGIPGRYYDRMRSSAPELLDRNVQHWLHNAPERRMVRMLDGKVRAFLSDRYRRLDNIDLMNQAVLPELAAHEGDLVFHVAALTDTRLYLRALLPGLQAEVKVGDVVQAGVQIRNSEVGNGALEVAPFLWRLTCLNGMVASDRSLRRYHVGRQHEEEAFAIYRDDTLAADDHAFFLKVRDAVGAALSEAQFTTIVDQLREATTGERIVDPPAATERLGKAHLLTEGEQTNILRYLATGGDLSAWGLANAVTRAAKDTDTWERQEELERVGGELVALPEREWAAIAR